MKEKMELFVGPCVLESEALAMEVCEFLVKELEPFEKRVSLSFKGSFDKANRSSIDSYRGPGIDEGLRILEKVAKEYGVKTITDYHSPAQADLVASVVDTIQVPAFLCRQTDLLIAAAQTGRVVNVKKGQFLSPQEMGNIIKKLEDSGTTNILLTERGTSFGYNNLVVDMRALPIMRRLGYPVVFDATHSVQLPGGGGTHSSGQREFVAPLARAAAAAGCDGFFMEVHSDPDSAPSDGPNMVRLSDLKPLLIQLLRICRASDEGDVR